jgi:tRNA1Val (adenine37-N6)-methyltransferase
MAAENHFRFKFFSVEQDEYVMKVNTDAVLLGAWSDVTLKQRALDVGTGTGVIALMLAQRNPELVMDAIDVEQAAARLAQVNFGSSPWGHRLKSYGHSIQEFADANDNSYDLIVSNPPFFTGGTLSSHAHKSKVRHTVKLPHADLLHAVRKLLTTEGHFDVVLPYVEGTRFAEIAEKYQLYLQRSTEIHPTPDKPVERLLMRFGKNNIKEEREIVILLNSPKDKDFTDWYRNLTKEYYLFL